VGIDVFLLDFGILKKRLSRALCGFSKKICYETNFAWRLWLHPLLVLLTKRKTRDRINYEKF